MPLTSLMPCRAASARASGSARNRVVVGDAHIVRPALAARAISVDGGRAPSEAVVCR